MTYEFKSIDHIQLAAPKGGEEKARKFFRDILGFDEIEKPEELKKRGGVWFGFGHNQIHIGIEEPFSPALKAHPGFEVVKLHELKQHLTNNNITFQEDDKRPGADRIYVHDPFGNRLEILEWIRN